MTSPLQDAIAATLPLVSREVDTPVAPFGYGTDISCDVDLQDDLRDVDGQSIQALGEALVRRLTCPRGALIDDPDYGIDVRGMVNTGTDVNVVRELAATVRGELLKDDRLAAVAVTVTPSSTGTTLDIAIAVTPADPATTRFTLTLAVTSADVILQELAS